MRVFVTGATGFIGSVVVKDLIEAGHEVVGLCRSDAGAKFLTEAGAEVHRGHLENLESLRSGAATADAVIHTAFIHDFSKFKENSEIDKRAIEAIGDVLAGTNKRFIVTGGTGVRTEDDELPAVSMTPRVSEQTALAQVARGVHAMVVRLPQVHDRDKHGLVGLLIGIAHQKGVSAYVGEGRNRWPAVHRLDAANLYKVVLEKGAVSGKYHAVAEEGVALREIAEAIGRRFKLPVVSKSAEEAAGHFGFMGFFVATDLPASSLLTQQRLGWKPVQTAGMIEDVDQANGVG